MKRQLIAALLALNVAAVAVPSATFTVSAAEVEAQAGITAEDQAIIDQQVASKAALDTYLSDNFVGASNAYKEAEKIVATGKTTIENTRTSVNAVKMAQDAVEAELANLATNSVKVTEKGKVDILLTKAEYNPANFLTESATKINSWATDAKNEIDAATTKKQAEAATPALEQKIINNKLKNAVDFKADYIKKVDEYVTNSAFDYAPENIATITGAQDDAKTAIDAAASEADVITAYNAMKSTIDAVPTKELASYKKTKKDQLNAYFAKPEASYTDVQKSAIATYKKEGCAAIDAATTQEKVNEAYDAAVKNIDSVLTKDDVDKAAKAVTEQIKGIGTITQSNYNEKYADIKSAEENLAKLEKGIEGAGAVDSDTKAILTAARAEYDKRKAEELVHAISILEFDAVTYDNRGEYKAELDKIAAAAETIINSTNVASVTSKLGTPTDPVNALTAYGKYNKAISKFQSDMESRLVLLIDTNLVDVINGTAKITDKNVAEVDEAIKLYDEISKLTNGDNTVINNRTKQYTKLVELYKAYKDEQEAAEAKFDLSKAKVSAVDPTEYTGSAIRPEVTLTDADGATIASTNYILAYDNNVNAGTAKVTAIATGNEYKKSVSATFEITPKALTSAKVVAADMYYYKGAARNASASVTVAGRNLANGTDYTVAYSNNKNIGTATMTITGKDNYTGTVKATYVIKPAKSAVKSLKAGKKKLTVKTEKQPGAKYQIAYKVKGGSYKTVKTSNVSKTIKSLKSGKTYAVKVRAYKSIGGKTYYGRYSAVKTVKVK